MGRSKKGPVVKTYTEFCYWCDKEFEDERILIQHQLTKHFRCPECKSGSSGKCNTLHGLIGHYRRVHTADLMFVPNAKRGRDNPMASMQIVGMRNVPEDVLAEWRQKSGLPLSSATTPAMPGVLPPALPMGLQLGDLDPAMGAPPAAANMPPLPGVLPPALLGLGDLVNSARGAAAPPTDIANLLGALPPGLPQMPEIQPVEPPAQDTQSSGGSDWAAQVQAWMASKKEEEKEEEPPPIPEEVALPPPVVETTNDFVPEYPEERPQERPPERPKEHTNEWTAPSSSLGPSIESGPLDPDKMRQMGFQISQPAQDTAKVRQHVQSTAAAFLSRGLGNLEIARASAASVSTVAQPKAAAPASTGAPAVSTASAAPAPPAAPALPAAGPTAGAQAIVPIAQTPSAIVISQPASKGQGLRSRSRGRRSSSRGRRDDHDYRGQRDNMPPPGGYESRTIQITGGVVGTRLWLKQEMERFGRVEVCHTGNRQNPEAEPPWVRFEKMSSVEVALQAIAAGQVLFDGNPIKATLKAARTGPPREVRQARERSPRRRDLEVTSRDLARDDRRGWGAGGSRDLGRDENRGQIGPGNYSSRDLFRNDNRGDRDRRRRRRSSSSRSEPRRRRH